MKWNKDMAAAPKDRDILVWYDHDADLYQDPENPGCLTDYGALAEGGSFLNGKGVAVAHWFARQFEVENEYGDGYWLPGGWFSRGDFDDYESVCNPIAWQEIEPPQ